MARGTRGVKMNTEVNIYDRTTRRKKIWNMEIRSWYHNSDSNNRILDKRSKLVLFVMFVMLDVADIVFTGMGLLKGIYDHYNPIAVFFYLEFGILTFILYRIVFMIVLIKVVIHTQKYIKPLMYPLLIAANYIYWCAVLYDLHSFDIINLFEIVPIWFIQFHNDVLVWIFKLFGVM